MVAWPIDKNSGQSLIVFEKKCIYSYMQCEYKETLHHVLIIWLQFSKRVQVHCKTKTPLAQLPPLLPRQVIVQAASPSSSSTCHEIA